MSRPGRIFTAASVQTIRDLAGQGKNASEIAAVIGSTSGSVRVKCSQLKIKLRRGRNPRVDMSQAQPQLREARLQIPIRPTIYSALVRKAAQMKTSSADLARMLLEAIVSGDLYEIVLKDSE